MRNTNHQGPGRAVTIIRRFFPEVDTVVDAKAPIEIEVTPKDVKASKKKEHSECALAVACKRQKHADGVVISISRAYVVTGSVATRYEVGEAAGREITSFDRGSEFSPGVYSLKKPNEHHAMRPRKGAMGKKTGERGKRVHRHVTDNIRTNL